MKITATQLRRIIKEESARITENSNFMEIRDILKQMYEPIKKLRELNEKLGELYMPSVDSEQPPELDEIYGFQQVLDDLSDAHNRLRIDLVQPSTSFGSMDD